MKISPVGFCVYNGYRKEALMVSEDNAFNFAKSAQLHNDLSGNLAAYRVVPVYTEDTLLLVAEACCAAIHEYNGVDITKVDLQAVIDGLKKEE